MADDHDRNRRKDADPELTLRELAAWFGVSKWALQEQERRGRIRFTRKLVNGVRTAVARPSQIRDLPIYRVGDVARILKVCTRTVRRWGDTGRLALFRRSVTDHWRTSPRALATFLRRRKEERRTPRPPKIQDVLDQILDDDFEGRSGR
jgi:predicted site-specific integrase-resolvase